MRKEEKAVNARLDKTNAEGLLNDHQQKFAKLDQDEQTKEENEILNDEENDARSGVKNDTDNDVERNANDAVDKSANNDAQNDVLNVSDNYVHNDAQIHRSVVNKDAKNNYKNDIMNDINKDDKVNGKSAASDANNDAKNGAINDAKNDANNDTKNDVMNDANNDDTANNCTQMFEDNNVDFVVEIDVSEKRHKNEIVVAKIDLFDDVDDDDVRYNVDLDSLAESLADQVSML